MFCKKPEKAPEGFPEKPQFEIKTIEFDYVEKTFKFSEKFLIEAIREKAERNGIIIAEHATASWWQLTSMTMIIEPDDRSAELNWREPINKEA